MKPLLALLALALIQPAEACPVNCPTLSEVRELAEHSRADVGGITLSTPAGAATLVWLARQVPEYPGREHYIDAMNRTYTQTLEEQ